MEGLVPLTVRDIVLDTLRCTMVHKVCSFLLVRGNQYVEDGSWGIVANLEGLGEYNWVEMVYELLVASLNEATAKISSC